MQVFFKIMNTIITTLYRVTGGKIGGHMNGGDVLLLTTVGRKSGEKRTTPVMYLRDGDGYLIAASAAGAPKSPGWYWNAAKGTAPVEIQVGSQTMTVDVTDLQGADRDQSYEKFKQAMESFVGYEEKVTRTIPVLKLSPQA